MKFLTDFEFTNGQYLETVGPSPGYPMRSTGWLSEMSGWSTVIKMYSSSESENNNGDLSVSFS